MLYEQHPSLVHSTVCVLIVPVKHNSQSGCDSSRATASTKQESQHACESSSKTGSIPDGHDGHLAWHSLEGINRLCTRVCAVSPRSVKKTFSSYTLMLGIVTVLDFTYCKRKNNQCCTLCAQLHDGLLCAYTCGECMFKLCFSSRNQGAVYCEIACCL